MDAHTQLYLPYVVCLKILIVKTDTDFGFAGFFYRNNIMVLYLCTQIGNAILYLPRTAVGRLLFILVLSLWSSLELLALDSRLGLLTSSHLSNPIC